MKTTKEMNQKGITLIALVITIIVMLILVAVTISMAVNGGLFGYAGKGGTQTNAAIEKEQELANLQANMTTEDLINKYTGNNGKVEVETISKTESYVGCYADIDGDEGIDGIIYADLARGNTKGEKWADDYGVYTIPVETGLKEYYVSGTADGPFGTESRNVIKAVSGTTGKDRFYVMALENVGSESTNYHWYYAASGSMSDYETATSLEFGKGKENTTNMIAKWDLGSAEGGYGAQDTGSYKDMWGEIKNQVSNGWFVPSRGEWAAFAQELGITSSICKTYGLSNGYWSSSQKDTSFSWCAELKAGYLWYRGQTYAYPVRLSATF